MKKLLYLIAVLALTMYIESPAQFYNTAEELIYYTQEWQGERFDDGRPKVPQEILERMKKISIEEAWGVMRSKGYHNQFEGDWVIIHEDEPIVGRVMTARYMPKRPEIMDRLTEKGQEIGYKSSWFCFNASIPRD